MSYSSLYLVTVTDTQGNTETVKVLAYNGREASNRATEKYEKEHNATVATCLPYRVMG